MVYIFNKSNKGKRGINNRLNREEIIRYLIDNTPMVLDIEKKELVYDTRSIYYKIYKYIKELEEKK